MDKKQKAKILEGLDAIRQAVLDRYEFEAPASRFGMTSGLVAGEHPDNYWCHVEVNISCQKIPHSDEEMEQVKAITSKWPGGRGL